MKGLVSLFMPSYPDTLIYMLQGTEYQASSYLKWFWRTNDFSQVMKRRKLERTKAARLLLMAVRLGMLLQVLVGLLFIWLWFARDVEGSWQFGISILLSYPIVWAHLVTVPLILGRVFIVNPKVQKLIKESKVTFAKHPGIKIAVAGSYGKTTMKELLGTVLSEGKNVAITPANKNVASSHAVFASQLKGDEEVLVIEYGEGRPGDVASFAEITQPTMGIITGIAPAHLDQYPSLEAAAKDIFSLADYLDNQKVYVNSESVAARPFIVDSHIQYSSEGVSDWRISNVSVGFDGVKFVMTCGAKKLKLHSGLLGRHQVGPLAAVVAIADKSGLNEEQIQAGIAKTTSFEHRMQARHIRGAWIIDDTYNGNIDGIKAGLVLLKELPAKRRIYVTPGLVDQGEETQDVHIELGRLIAKANPDKVVLMENSVTRYIQAGMEELGYAGELELQDDPLDFYTNIDQFLASGDVILMQNDWTDNYN